MKHLAFGIVLPIAVLVGCGGEAVERRAPGARLDPVVFTSAPSLQALAEAVTAGVDLPFEVRCPVPAGADPEHWVPDRETVGCMVRAQAILMHGVGMESWLGLVALPPSRTSFCGDALRGRLIEREGETHTHGGGEHTHGSIHPWVAQDPDLVQLQLVAVADALAGLVDDEAKRAAMGDAAAAHGAAIRAAADALRAWKAERAGAAWFGDVERFAYLARWLGVELRPLGDLVPGARSVVVVAEGAEAEIPAGCAGLIVDARRGAAAGETWWRVAP